MTPIQNQARELTEKIVATLAEDHDIESAELLDFPKASKFTWPDMTIDLAEKLPFDPRYVAFDAFEGDAYDPLNDHSPGDVRIYCMPVPEMSGSLPYIRIKMSRQNPSGSRFLLTEKGFVDEIAASGQASPLASRKTRPAATRSMTACSATRASASRSYPRRTTGRTRKIPPPTYCGHCGRACRSRRNRCPRVISRRRCRERRVLEQGPSRRRPLRLGLREERGVAVRHASRAQAGGHPYGPPLLETVLLRRPSALTRPWSPRGSKRCLTRWRPARPPRLARGSRRRRRRHEHRGRRVRPR